MSDSRHRLAGVNLNLFPVLDAMLRHHSVTRSARELGVTPSAVSHSLRELRGLLGDPLFVRTGSRMVPTPRARAVGAQLRGGLGLLGQVVQPPTVFDPSASTRVCVIATSDEALMAMLPGAFERIRERAPNMVLDVRPRSTHSMQMLELGEVDLLLRLEEDVPTWACRTTLDTGNVVCVVRADHPRVGDTLTPELFATLPHVRISPQGFGSSRTEQRLSELGIERRIAVYTYSFATAPEFVARSDAILTLPEWVARRIAPRLGLRILAPPIPLPGFVLDLIWHQARDDDALSWLRSVLMEEADSVRAATEAAAAHTE